MNDFRDYKGYCEYTYGDVMHARGGRGKLSHSRTDYIKHYGIKGMKWHDHIYKSDKHEGSTGGLLKQNKSMKDSKKDRKELNFIKNYIANNKIPGGLRDFNEFYEKCSLNDWKKIIECAMQGDDLGVQSLLVKYTLGRPVTVTGTSLSDK